MCALLSSLQSQKSKTPTRHSMSRTASSSSSSSSDLESPGDDNTTIRRLRKSNAELNSTLTQLKNKVRLLESDRDRSTRTVGIVFPILNCCVSTFCEIAHVQPLLQCQSLSIRVYPSPLLLRACCSNLCVHSAACLPALICNRRFLQ